MILEELIIFMIVNPVPSLHSQWCQVIELGKKLIMLWEFWNILSPVCIVHNVQHRCNQTITVSIHTVTD